MAATIVLVPGIGLGGVELLVLARRLRGSGFRVRVFWNNPWRRSLAESACALHRFLSLQECEAPHIVAHSLSGLVTLQMLREFPTRSVGRIVFLGTPLSGCLAAQRVLRIPGGRWLLGDALASICAGSDLCIPPGCAVAGIGGRLNLLLGLVLCPRKPNDTLVCVEETQHSGLSAHCVLPVSHTSMLMSRQVSRWIAAFLHAGAFPAAENSTG